MYSIHAQQKAKSPGGATPGDFFFRLYCRLFVSIKPFANIVGNYTCSDRDQERDQVFHSCTSSLLERVDSMSIVP